MLRKIKDSFSAETKAHAYDIQMLPVQGNEMKVWLWTGCCWALACQQKAGCQVQCSWSLGASFAKFSLIIFVCVPPVSTISLSLKWCLRSWLNDVACMHVLAGFLLLLHPIFPQRVFNAEHMLQPTAWLCLQDVAVQHMF